MKPFRPKTIAQQKKDYVRALRRAYSLRRSELANEYAEALEYARIALQQASEIRQRIDYVLNRIADQADVEFGAIKWRRNKILLGIVDKRMTSRVAFMQSQVDRLVTKADRHKAPYEKAMRAAKIKFEKLLRTVE